ncbi:MAG: hypothetical protein QMD13_00815 [Candidatus Bathyarchaeia archaeon]|nr:hypothetical protein [Candidatus Bathyarchaeia archaeon]
MVRTAESPLEPSTTTGLGPPPPWIRFVSWKFAYDYAEHYFDSPGAMHTIFAVATNFTSSGAVGNKH